MRETGGFPGAGCLPPWKPCLVFSLFGDFVVPVPVGPLGAGGSLEEARTGVSGRRGALLELGFHFRKESGVTAIPGHRIVTHEKVCRHTAAFIKKKKSFWQNCRVEHTSVFSEKLLTASVCVGEDFS